jgi:uncharacterized protein YndB with AHSA1/START domain
MTSMALTSYTIVRSFPVTPARLFRAFTVPADVAAWVWGANARDVRAQIDARPGGAIEVTCAGRSAEAPRPGYRGVCVDVVPGRRLVYTNHWDSDVGYNAPGMHPIDEVFVVEIDADPAGSRLSLTHHGIPDDGHSAAAHEDGVRSTLDDLARHLAASPR